jgi:hypothetical protein
MLVVCSAQVLLAAFEARGPAPTSTQDAWHGQGRHELPAMTYNEVQTATVGVPAWRP